MRSRDHREHTAARPERKCLVEVENLGRRKGLVQLGWVQSGLDRYCFVNLVIDNASHQ